MLPILNFRTFRGNALRLPEAYDPFMPETNVRFSSEGPIGFWEGHLRPHRPPKFRIPNGPVKPIQKVDWEGFAPDSTCRTWFSGRPGPGGQPQEHLFVCGHPQPETARMRSPVSQGFVNSVAILAQALLSDAPNQRPHRLCIDGVRILRTSPRRHRVLHEATCDDIHQCRSDCHLELHPCQ